jgi:hypothetical protein
MAMTKKSYPWRWKGWWRSATGAVIIKKSDHMSALK